MSFIVGVVGQIGSGKGTFTTFLKAAAAPKSVAYIRFSDILVRTLDLWGIPLTRANLQNLAIIMDREYGKGSVTRATEQAIRKESSDIIVVEGVRWKQDVPMISSFEKSLLVYITADPKIRFERIKKRSASGPEGLRPGGKVGESDISYQQFEQEEKAGTEIEIPEIGANADFKIENNGSLDEMRLKVEAFYKTKFFSTKKS